MGAPTILPHVMLQGFIRDLTSGGLSEGPTSAPALLGRAAEGHPGSPLGAMRERISRKPTAGHDSVEREEDVLGSLLALPELELGAGIDEIAAHLLRPGSPDPPYAGGGGGPLLPGGGVVNGAMMGVRETRRCFSTLRPASDGHAVDSGHNQVRCITDHTWMHN